MGFFSNFSHFILTPRHIQIHIEAPPDPPRSGRDRSGSRGSAVAPTIGTMKSTSRSVGTDTSSSTRWSSFFSHKSKRKSVSMGVYNRAATAPLPSTNTASIPFENVSPHPEIVSPKPMYAHGHTRTYSHPQVLEGMVGGIPFPTLEVHDTHNNVDEFGSRNTHGRYFSHDYERGQHFHPLPPPARNQVDPVDAAATALAVASLGGIAPMSGPVVTGTVFGNGRSGSHVGHDYGNRYTYPDYDIDSDEEDYGFGYASAEEDVYREQGGKSVC